MRKEGIFPVHHLEINKMPSSQNVSVNASITNKITISAVLKNTTTSMIKIHYQLCYMDGSTTESISWKR
jgi:uncharacterized protein YcfL